MRHHVIARGGREHPISSFTASPTEHRVRPGCADAGAGAFRLCVLFHCFFLPGHHEFSVPPPPPTFVLTSVQFVLFLLLVLPWSLPCSLGIITLVSILRRYSHTSKISWRSLVPITLPRHPLQPPSLLSWYLMTTLFIVFFFLSFVWILVLFFGIVLHTYPTSSTLFLNATDGTR